MQPTIAWPIGAALLVAGLAMPPALAQKGPANPAASRGALLYSTHCIACHTTQVHWRDKKLATDWVSLKAQVRRWQAVAMLGWKEDDVTEVARHLNARYYGYLEPKAALAPPRTVALND